MAKLRRASIVDNPLHKKMVGKPLKPIMEFKEKTNVALAITPKARTIIKENPSLILKLLKFIREGKNSSTTKAFSFKKLEQSDSFLAKVGENKFFIKKIINSEKTPNWASHAYNSAVISESLRKIGVNTIPVHFAFVNEKKGESYIAYEYTGLKDIKTAAHQGLITTEEYNEFKKDMISLYLKLRDKIKKEKMNFGFKGKELSFGFYEDYEVLVDPISKKLQVFEPHVDSLENIRLQRKRYTSQDY
ncbi:MAG: hypothetical protein WCX82_04615 [archaeon]|jgi:hypothetical protein